MISDLISDLVNEKGSLSQAFIRAKVISAQIDKPSFSDWIAKEINGYKTNSELPDYRVLDCQTYLVAESGLGRPIRILVRLSEPYKSVEEFISHLHMTNSISAIEQQLKELSGPVCIYRLPANEVKAVSLLYNQFEKSLISITQGEKEINKIHLHEIVTQTRHRLLDELLLLMREYPELSEQISPEDMGLL